MHEMSAMVRLAGIAEANARAQGAVRVRKMTVAVGAMTGILPVYLKKYFPEATRGTLLEGAELVCDEIPVQVCCAGCGGTYAPNAENGRKCPVCGDVRGKVVAGRELTVVSLEIEEE